MLARYIRQTSPVTPCLRLVIIFVPVLFILAGCGGSKPPAGADAGQTLDSQTGLASYYHPSLAGEKTASGVAFDNEALMAAHPTYPLGTRVRVTNLEKEGAAVEVRIMDRGPTEANRAEGVIIDLSRAAAEALGMVRDGRTKVRVEVLEWGQDERK
jgi:rare lipoprotein A